MRLLPDSVEKNNAQAEETTNENIHPNQSGVNLALLRGLRSGRISQTATGTTPAP